MLSGKATLEAVLVIWEGSSGGRRGRPARLCWRAPCSSAKEALIDDVFIRGGDDRRCHSRVGRRYQNGVVVCNGSTR